MPQITAIKPQKSKKRVNVYLDHKFGFGLDLETFVKLGLKVEQYLEDKKIKEIVKEANFQKALDGLIRFSTLRPRSEKEISDWLKRKKIHTSLHKSLFNRLKRLELADDQKFAIWWVEQRVSFRPRGKRGLISELRQKGIGKEEAVEAIEKAGLDEEKLAKKLIAKKAYKWEKLGKREKKQKMSQFLARQGFDWGTIKNVIE